MPDIRIQFMSALSASTLKPAKNFWRRKIRDAVRCFVRFFHAPLVTSRRRDDDRPGLEGAGKPVPWHPTPPHHLVAAKALPPSDRTFLYPRD